MSSHDPGFDREYQPLVLIVDDDLSFVRYLTAIVQSAGFRTTSAADGPTGLAIAEKYRPNVVLLDLDIPDMSGFEVCEQIKGRLSTADIPIIFITGADRTDAMIERCFAIGANDFLGKPTSKVDLLARLRVVLREQHLRDAYRKLALEDPFTTLANRRQFFMHITEAVMASKRDKSESILVIGDIDNVMSANDAFGYDLGDELILTFGRLMKRLGGADIRAGRIGGDELALIMRNCSKETALATANRLRQTFASIAFDAATSPKHFTATFGLASFQGEPGDFDGDDLLRQADTALFAAKQLGRSRLVAYWQLDPDEIPEVSPGQRHARTKRRKRTDRAFIGVAPPESAAPNESQPSPGEPARPA